MKNLNYQSLLPIAIAEGATSPNPGIVGVLVWSTTLLTTMRWNSTNWESLVTKSELDGKLGNASPQTLTVNSASAALKITQAGAGDALVVEDVASDTTPFVINSTGNVIVGHSTSSVLGVTADNSGSDLKYIFNIAGATQATAGMTMSMWGNSTVNSLGAQIIGAKSRTETGIGVHGAVIDGDRLLTLIGEGSDGTQFKRAAAIKIEVDGTVSTDIVPGKITFYTTPASGGAPIQALQIKNDNTFIHHWVAVGINNTNAIPWFTSCPGKPTVTPTVPYTDAVGLRFDSVNKKLWGYFGSEWLNLSFTTEALDLPARVLALEASGGGSGVVISDTPPGSPTNGMEWFHTTSGIQYTRVAGAWIEPGGSQAPSGSVSPILSWMI